MFVSITSKIMSLTVKHQYASQIMDFLAREYDVRDDETYLLGEPIINLICNSGHHKMEDDVAMQIDPDCTVTIPKNLVFIDSLEVVRERVCKGENLFNPMRSMTRIDEEVKNYKRVS